MMKKPIRHMLAAAAAGMVLSMAAIPETAFAAKTAVRYEPKRVTSYRLNAAGNWELTSSETRSYKKKRLSSGKSYYDGDLLYSAVYRYTKKKGRVTKETQVYQDSDEKRTFVTTYKYKKKKRVSASVRRSGKAYASIAYKYKGNKLVKETVSLASGPVMTYTYSYNKEKLRKETYTYSSGDYYYTETISYSKFNKYGDPAKAVCTYNRRSGSHRDAGTAVTTYSRKYDKKKKVCTEVIASTKHQNGSSSKTRTVYESFVKVKEDSAVLAMQ